MPDGGSETTTTIIQPAAPTAQQQELTAKQVEFADLQLAAIRQSSDFNQQAFEQFGPLVESQQAEFERQQARLREQEPIQDELRQIQLENIRRGTAATPEQIEQIDAIRASQLASGEADISRFQSLANEQLREELAPRLGLRPTDTPILDRGSRVAAEATRQQGQLVRGLDVAAAQGKLNFPLAAQQAQAAQAQFQQGLGFATQEFQANLRNSAFNNRLALTSLQGGQGLGLASNIPGASSLASAAGIFGQNQGGTSTATTNSQLGLGEILTASGNFLSGLSGFK